ncbi:MAG TPA: hypothetical protein VFB96_12560 [Pirellulaceae bacterium]|jgi:hypothetical protein|nr:hypothetical protein [Pirellulaceae bacterium]
MGRITGLSLLAIVALLASGCAMCCSPYDDAYGHTGGILQRTDLCHGRVGSAFAPAGAPGETVIVESEALPLPEAPTPHEPHAPMKSVKRSSDWSGDLSGE